MSALGSSHVRLARWGGVLAETREGGRSLASLAPHAHDEYQIILSEGVAGTYRIAGRDHEAPPFSAVVINPGVVHAARGCSDLAPGLPLCTLLLAPDLLTPGADAPAHFPKTVLEDRRTYRELFRLHRAVVDLASSSEIEILACEVLAGLVASHAAPRPSASTAPVRPSVLRWRASIDADFAREVPLVRLAEESGVGLSHLCRVFREEVGLPPHAYRVQRRIQAARRLLEDGVPIGEAALEAGFSDQPHLTRVFRRFVGVTPGRYSLGRAI